MVYKALLIAVDQYLNTSPLPNTVNDVSEIKRLLLEPPSFFKKEGSSPFSVIFTQSQKHISWMK
ncbi:caspase family protein [Geobacillus thermoleovorans]|uniref:caspase family protein n=1 Tax=Geobacillus thermoleovorans TaxID=33941 RepID=UPI000FE13E13|nr:caspase family protein [Geobacillus thermoleovorans]